MFCGVSEDSTDAWTRADPTTVVTRSMRIFELVLGLMVMAVYVLC